MYFTDVSIEEGKSFSYNNLFDSDCAVLTSRLSVLDEEIPTFFAIRS